MCTPCCENAVLWSTSQSQIAPVGPHPSCLSSTPICRSVGKASSDVPPAQQTTALPCLPSSQLAPPYLRPWPSLHHSQGASWPAKLLATGPPPFRAAKHSTLECSLVKGGAGQRLAQLGELHPNRPLSHQSFRPSGPHRGKHNAWSPPRSQMGMASPHSSCLSSTQQGGSSGERPAMCFLCCKTQCICASLGRSQHRLAPSQLLQFHPNMPVGRESFQSRAPPPLLQDAVLPCLHWSQLAPLKTRHGQLRTTLTCLLLIKVPTTCTQYCQNVAFKHSLVTNGTGQPPPQVPAFHPGMPAGRKSFQPRAPVLQNAVLLCLHWSQLAPPTTLHGRLRTTPACLLVGKVSDHVHPGCKNTVFWSTS